MNWFKHAFAVKPSLPEPTEEQRLLVDRVCREIVRRRMAAPALAFLEMSRPLNFLGAQALHFLAPIISLVVEDSQHRAFAEFLERRDSVDILCRRIETLEAESKATPSDESTSDESTTSSGG